MNNMAVAARKQNNEQSYIPGTRVYYYSNASAAAQPEYVPGFQEEEYLEPRTVKRTVTRRRSKAKAVIAAFGLSAVFAAMFLMIRYADISKAYLEVNNLKNSINVCEQQIKALDVELQCAINMEDARELARQQGMDYPTAGQIMPADEIQGTDPER